MKRTEDSLETLLAQAGHFIDPATGAIVPPIHPSTTYARDDRYELIGYGYSRSGSPTCSQVESVLARLEGAEDALVFASGARRDCDVLRHGARWRAGRRAAGHVSRRGGLAAPASPRAAGSRSRSSTRRRRGSWTPSSVPARPAVVWIEPLGQSDLGRDRCAGCGGDRSCEGRDPGSRCDRDARGDAARPRPRRRYRLPLGHEVSRRPQRRHGRGARDSLSRRAVGGREARAHADGWCARTVRMLAAAARHAHPARALRAPGVECDGGSPGTSTDIRSSMRSSTPGSNPTRGTGLRLGR